MRKTTARIIAVAAALALTTAALTTTTIAVAAAHAPIADIVIGVVRGDGRSIGTHTWTLSL